MRFRFRFAFILSTIASIAVTESAHAGSMDPSIERLVLNTKAANNANVPDNAAFNNLISELGFAMSSDVLHPARTTGFGGFALTIEAAFTEDQPRRDEHRHRRHADAVLARGHARPDGPEHEKLRRDEQEPRRAPSDLFAEGAQRFAARVRGDGRAQLHGGLVAVDARRRHSLGAVRRISHRRGRRASGSLRRRKRAHDDGHGSILADDRRSRRRALEADPDREHVLDHAMGRVSTLVDLRRLHRGRLDAERRSDRSVRLHGSRSRDRSARVQERSRETTPTSTTTSRSRACAFSETAGSSASRSSTR